MSKSTHAGVTWNGWPELSKYCITAFLADQALHTVLKHLAHRDGKWGTQVSSLCVTLPSHGNGSNKEQIDRTQWASLLGPKRTGMSSQEEKSRAPSFRVRGRLTGSCWLYPTWVRHALIGLVAVPADFSHLQTPEKNYTMLYVFRSYNWIGCTSAFFCGLVKIERTENITQKCAHSCAVSRQIYVLEDACIFAYQHI